MKNKQLSLDEYIKDTLDHIELSLGILNFNMSGLLAAVQELLLRMPKE